MTGPAVVGHRINGGAVRIRLSFPSPKCPKTSGLASDTVDGRNPALVDIENMGFHI